MDSEESDDFDYWFYDDVTLTPEQEPLYNKVVHSFLFLAVVCPIILIIILVFIVFL